MNVQVPVETFAAIQKFVALFSSGNNIPVDIKYLTSLKGDTIIKEGQELNDALKQITHKVD